MTLPHIVTLLLSLILAFFPSGLYASTSLEKISALAATTSDNVITPDSTEFFNLIADTKDRDYYVVALFTVTAAEYQCEPCKKVDPEFRKMAASYRESLRGKNHDALEGSRVFYAIVDHSRASEVFKKMSITQIPVPKLYYPNAGPKKTEKEPETYDFNRMGTEVDKLLNFITARTEYHFQIIEPIDYALYIKFAFTLIAISAASSFLLPVLLPVLTSRRLWATGSLVIILLYTSGYMWVRIRQPAFTGGTNERGTMNWIAAGLQTQYGVETQIVAALYAVCAFTVVNLVVKVPGMGNVAAQKAVLVLSLVILIGAYSLLLSIFRIKSPNYPFRLLL